MDLKIVENIEKVCSFLAFFTNSITLFLIIFKSPTRIGVYKYLMIYIALFEFLYAALNLISPPQVFTADSGFLVVMDQEKSIFPVKYCLIMYFVMFGTSLANFGVHFVFRYFAITGNTKFTSFDPFKLMIWISSPLSLGILNAVFAVNFLKKSDATEQFLKSKILKISTETSIDNLSFMGFYIYPTDRNGKEYVNWHCIFGVISVSTLLTFSISIMLYFGTKCYKELKKLTDSSTVSENYRSIQNQLFLALVVQTLIPLVLMNLPSTVIVLFCFFDRATNIIGMIGCVFVTFHVVLDPLPIIFIIKPYRDAFLGFILCTKRTHQIAPSSSLMNAMPLNVITVTNN